jgi:nicotinamide riboside transporter PnuC
MLFKEVINRCLVWESYTHSMGRMHNYWLLIVKIVYEIVFTRQQFCTRWHCEALRIYSVLLKTQANYYTWTTSRKNNETNSSSAEL